MFMFRNIWVLVQFYSGGRRLKISATFFFEAATGGGERPPELN